VRKIAPLAAGFLLFSACSGGNGTDAATSGSDLTGDRVLCSPLDAPTTASLVGIAGVAATCNDAPLPDGGAKQPWKRGLESKAIAALEPNHRGRDLFFTPGEDQWVIGKIAYGPLDVALHGEDVGVYVLRGCSGQWERLGTATTTFPGTQPTVEGVEDKGGRVFFRIPDDKKLAVGRHRVRMVVAGDLTGADQYIEVLPKGAPIFVSDVDGTLTEKKGPDLGVICDEEADPAALVASLGGGSAQPNVHAGAPELYGQLVGIGARVLYLTARPEWLEPHTHKFLHERFRGDGRGDLPEGLVHTTLTEFGALPSAAQVFKHDELQMLRDKGLKIVLGFGDQGSDVNAYTASQIPYRFYYEKRDAALRNCSDIANLPLAPRAGLTNGNWRHQAYTDLLPVFSPLVEACLAR
jgi:hypothetical protein